MVISLRVGVGERQLAADDLDIALNRRSVRRAAARVAGFRPVAGPVPRADGEVVRLRVEAVADRRSIQRRCPGHHREARRQRVVDRDAGERIRSCRGRVGDRRCVVEGVAGEERRSGRNARSFRDRDAARGHVGEIGGGEGLRHRRAVADRARRAGSDIVLAQRSVREHGRRGRAERDRNLLVRKKRSTGLGGGPGQHIGIGKGSGARDHRLIAGARDEVRLPGGGRCRSGQASGACCR